MRKSFAIPVYIAAGGRSQRFGSDKARALLHGVPLICHVADTFSTVASSITVVADTADKYLDLGLQTIPDRVVGLGPIGGLYTAIHHVVASHYTDSSDTASDNSSDTASDNSSDAVALPWFLFVSCDMMGLRVSWVHDLWRYRTLERPIVAFGSEPWDPLFSLVHPTVLPVVEQRIVREQRAMWSLFQEVAVPVPHPAGWSDVISINTQEALVARESSS